MMVAELNVGKTWVGLQVMVPKHGTGRTCKMVAAHVGSKNKNRISVAHHQPEQWWLTHHFSDMVVAHHQQNKGGTPPTRTMVVTHHHSESWCKTTIQNGGVPPQVPHIMTYQQSGLT